MLAPERERRDPHEPRSLRTTFRGVIFTRLALTAPAHKNERSRVRKKSAGKKMIQNHVFYQSKWRCDAWGLGGSEATITNAGACAQKKCALPGGRG